MRAGLPPTAGRKTLDGSLWGFVAEALILPCGLLLTGFLTRRLGVEEYGLLAVAGSLLAWLEWSLTAMLSRPTIEFTRQAEDWRPVAATALRAHLAVGVAAGAALFGAAHPLAAAVQAPEMAWMLMLLALDVPLFLLAQAHRAVLIGLGEYRARALSGAGRWVARVVVALALVGAGLGVEGALAAILAASVVELGVARWRIQPRLWQASALTIGGFFRTSVPLLLASLSVRLFEKLDLLSLMLLGEGAAVAGVYGAAQNLALIPALMSAAAAPLIHSTLTQLLKEGKAEEARHTAREALRGMLALAPFAAAGAGCAEPLVALAFGPGFADAEFLLPRLLWAGVALALVAAALAILTAWQKLRLVAWLTVPLVPLAALALARAVPQGHALAATEVMLALSTLGALTALGTVSRACGVRPPLASAARMAVISGVVYATGLGLTLLRLPWGALWLCLQLAIAGGVTAGLLAVWEFRPEVGAFLARRGRR